MEFRLKEKQELFKFFELYLNVNYKLLKHIGWVGQPQNERFYLLNEFWPWVGTFFWKF